MVVIGTLLAYAGAVLAVLWIAKYCMDRVIPYVKRRSIEELPQSERSKETTEALRYAMDVNAMLSCLEFELKDAASPSNVHVCKIEKA